jgi:succinate dehydrogenase / fumarate reductase iron-sulfur subunit
MAAASSDQAQANDPANDPVTGVAKGAAADAAPESHPEQPAERAALAALAPAERRPELARPEYAVAPGHLPVTEVTFNRAGAASPFGDDVRFPLPLDQITYVHPSEDAPASLH